MRITAKEEKEEIVMQAQGGFCLKKWNGALLRNGLLGNYVYYNLVSSFFVLQSRGIRVR